MDPIWNQILKSYFVEKILIIFDWPENVTFQKIQRLYYLFSILEVGRANKGLKRQIGQWAKQTGLEHNRAMMKNRHAALSMWTEMKYKISDKMVFQVWQFLLI